MKIVVMQRIYGHGKMVYASLMDTRFNTLVDRVAVSACSYEQVIIDAYKAIDRGENAELAHAIIDCCRSCILCRV